MFKGLGIVFIAHLGTLGTVGNGQVILCAYNGAGVVLNTQEVIALNVGKIMGKFLSPGFLRSGFAALHRLQIVKAQGQANLNLRIQSLNSFLCGLMTFHGQLVAVLTAA